jgi:hypothetical protein
MFGISHMRGRAGEDLKDSEDFLWLRVCLCLFPSFFQSVFLLIFEMFLSCELFYARNTISLGRSAVLCVPFSSLFLLKLDNVV